MKYDKQTLLRAFLFLMLVVVTTLASGQSHRSAKQCNCGSHGIICTAATSNQKVLDRSTSVKVEKRSSANSLGTVQPNTNPVLPSSYNFMEYVFPEPNDQGTCLGVVNTTAVIEEVFMSQTHRHAVGHPLFFTIGERPALLQLAVTGSGASPDVQVEGVLNGNSLGTLCLDGPAVLSTSINLDQPNFSDYFSVTLPKAWIKDGLVLNLSAGDATQTLTQTELKISPYTELNLVEFKIDMMDYNYLPHGTPVFDDFLQELASAMPVSVIRYGQFPAELKTPTVAVQLFDGDTYVVDNDQQLEPIGLNTGYINAIGLDLISNIQLATGDLPNTIYFGNTLNLTPGGWGGDGSFVSYDFTDIFIHELGHALSLPHWGEESFRLPNPTEDQYSYPYGGELDTEAGGRGNTWNFIQDMYEFVSPTCELAGQFNQPGTERSDAMAREFPCAENRSDGQGPWDGFSDFSAKAMHNYLIGAQREFGQVQDRGQLIDFHFPKVGGYPSVTLVNGERQINRTNVIPQTELIEDEIKLPGQEQVEQDVYLIYGSMHATKPEANIIYEPIKYKGTLLPSLDPTDPITFAALQNVTSATAPNLYYQHRDVTLRLTYDDGTIKHALVPFEGFEYPTTGAPDEELSPGHFGVVVPGDKGLCAVDLYRRDFIIAPAWEGESGNINDPSQNITAANFMNAAILMSSLDHSCNCPGTPGYVAPGTACDDGNPYTINDVEDGFCNCEGELVDIAPCGVIQNGQFEVDLSNWWTWGTDATSTNAEASFIIENEFDAGIAQAGFVFETDTAYTLSFEAYADQPRSIELFVYLNEGAFPEYFTQIVNLTTTKQAYEYTFTYTDPSITNGGLSFSFAGDLSSVFLDNICLDKACDMLVDPDCMGLPLPVNFISFTGEIVEDDIELTWNVTEEINLSHYTVQHAYETNPTSFESIGEVAAAELSEYRFLHVSPESGSNYYRIQGVDLDGTVTNTSVIVVMLGVSTSVEDTSVYDVRLFPNPVSQKINLSKGKLTQIVNANGEPFPVSLEVSQLPSGLYFAHILVADRYVVVKKFIKQ